MIGQVLLNKYKVTRLLDEGGMSKVYVAQQMDQDREVAVKILRDHLAGQPKVREHFRREIYIMRRFQHPNAVALLDADPDAKTPFLVMELLRGVDLLHLLERHQRFTPERAGRFLGQLCEVLQSLHDGGIIHRDLKPGNLMVLHPDTPQEHLKLMDFGLAKMSSLFYISPEELENMPAPTASGTPEYISPEQVRGNEVDRRGDLYSVGVILYEMLAGRRPFESDDVETLLLAHADESPPTFAELGLPDLVPPALEEVVRSCLEKYPERRPRTTEELALRFEDALGKKIYNKPDPAVAAAVAATATPPPSSGVIYRPPPAAARGNGKPPSSADRLAALTVAEKSSVVHELSAAMPESMAMLKLKGFISDLGGEIIESVPGMIRVRLGEPEAPRKPAGLFGWLTGRTAATAEPTTTVDMELLMEKKDAAQPNRLFITLTLRNPAGPATTAWQSRCAQIVSNLKAYL